MGFAKSLKTLKAPERLRFIVTKYQRAKEIGGGSGSISDVDVGEVLGLLRS